MTFTEGSTGLPTEKTTGLLISGKTHVALLVNLHCTVSPLFNDVVFIVPPVSPGMSCPLSTHWNVGVWPPLVIFALKTAGFPEHHELPTSDVMVIVGVEYGVTFIVTWLLPDTFGTGQTALEVISHHTISPLDNVDEV